MKKKDKVIRAYPKKQFVGWQIPAPGGRMFTPQSEDDYLEVPASLTVEARKNRFITIKEDKNG